MTYVDIRGWPTWHEVTGDGPPVVLLHGAFAGASSWAAQTPALVAAGYRVLAPERRGHAHTADVPGPLTYDVMAEDTVAYLDQVVAGPAHLIGWSDGAVVGLLVALRRPDLVDRLVLIGQYYDSSGKVPGSAIEQFLATEQAKQYLRAGYDPYSPDGPEHFDVVYAKTLEMIATEPELELGSFAALAAATLVLQGDRDEVRVEHSLAVVAAIPDARLAVLPGTHLLPVESPDLVNALLISFLAGEPGPPAWAG